MRQKEKISHSKLQTTGTYALAFSDFSKSITYFFQQYKCPNMIQKCQSKRKVSTNVKYFRTNMYSFENLTNQTEPVYLPTDSTGKVLDNEPVICTSWRTIFLYPDRTGLPVIVIRTAASP